MRSRSRAATVPFFVDRLAANAAPAPGRPGRPGPRPGRTPARRSARRRALGGSAAAAGRPVRGGELLARARSGRRTWPPSSASHGGGGGPWRRLRSASPHGGRSRASRFTSPEIERELGAAIHVATGIPVRLERPGPHRLRRGSRATASSTRSSASPGREASRSAAPDAWPPCSRAASTHRWRPGA